MATATWTSTLAGAANPPKGGHRGVESVVVQITGAASATVGDVFRMVKVPDRATILGGRLYVVPSAGALDVAVEVKKVEHSGTSSVIATLLASTSGSATTLYDLSAMAGVGFQVSLSDDLATKFVFVDCSVKAVGTTSASPIFKLKLDYLPNDSA